MALGSGIRRVAGNRSTHGQHVSRRALSVVSAAAPPALTGVALIGVGSSAPATVISNADLERFVDTNDEWITARTGIKRRHVLGEGESMAQHAAKASQRALEMAGIGPEAVDMVLLATSTPDDAFGSACQVRAARPRRMRMSSVLLACGTAH